MPIRVPFFARPPDCRNLVERGEMFHRRRATVRVADDDMDVVKSLFQQLQHARALGKRVREFHAPRPGIPHRRLLRLHDPCLAAINGEVVPGIAVPRVETLARPSLPRARGAKRRGKQHQPPKDFEIHIQASHSFNASFKSNGFRHQGAFASRLPHGNEGPHLTLRAGERQQGKAN